MELQYNPLPITIKTQGVAKLQGSSDGDLLVSASSEYKNLTTSSLVQTGPGYLIGVVINNHTNGTMRLWDNTVPAVTPMTGVITFSAVATTGERFIPFYGAFFTTGLYCSLSGSDITLMYN